MLTIQQMIRAVRDLQARVEKLEAAKIDVAPVEVEKLVVRRGRSARVVDEPVEVVEPIPVEVTL